MHDRPARSNDHADPAQAPTGSAAEKAPRNDTGKARQPYVPPAIRTVAGELSALLDTTCAGPGSGTAE